MKHTELLQLQTGADGEPNKENSNSKELFIRRRIENTPFMVNGNDEKGYVLTFGKYKVTEPQKTPEEAEALLESKKWFILIDTVICILDMIEHNKLYTVEGENKKG